MRLNFNVLIKHNKFVYKKSPTTGDKLDISLGRHVLEVLDEVRENLRVAKKYNADMIEVIKKWRAYKLSFDPEWKREAQFIDVFDSVGSDGVLKLLNESRGSGKAAFSSVEDYMESLLKLAAENEGDSTPNRGN
ncbi:hypothetical protein BPAE_0283g00090 [Botrytis paeoniae]|uniref:Uncharacterized protein n=1 Tax=Botrytis paeoniae TaxID=278948 RepID=A0A4Z1FG42_9HELO|nr:hypothetical protein BPAE_0283g00090 [Botrytis paeoniae]